QQEAAEQGEGARNGTLEVDRMLNPVLLRHAVSLLHEWTGATVAPAVARVQAGSAGASGCMTVPALFFGRPARRIGRCFAARGRVDEAVATEGEGTALDVQGFLYVRAAPHLSARGKVQGKPVVVVSHGSSFRSCGAGWQQSMHEAEGAGCYAV